MAVTAPPPGAALGRGGTSAATAGRVAGGVRVRPARVVARMRGAMRARVFRCRRIWIGFRARQRELR